MAVLLSRAAQAAWWLLGVDDRGKDMQIDVLDLRHTLSFTRMTKEVRVRVQSTA
jgi:hypothetical protein